MKFEWEQIDDGLDFGQQTSRAKVWGGWLIKEEIYIDNDGSFESTHISLAFITDANHEWEIDNS